VCTLCCVHCGMYCAVLALHLAACCAVLPSKVQLTDLACLHPCLSPHDAPLWQPSARHRGTVISAAGIAPSCTAVASDAFAADEFADVEGGEGVELDDDWGLDEDEEK
jgi:hypothetical protein